VELHKDDLDHDRQLTRSRHEAQIREYNHLATAMDPWYRGGLLTHHSGGKHGDEERPPVMIPLSDRVPGRAFGPSRSRIDDGGGLQYFSWMEALTLGFSR
jgi:hypothetical protein